MDTELARTFLIVVAAGNFIKAAERLYVTQSTVSTRIRALEESLGTTLFVRNKAGTTLTPSGRRFQKHAAILIRTLEQAHQEAGIPEGYKAALTVGGRFGLWEQLLLTWLGWMRTHAKNISLRAQVGFEEDLMHHLVEGSVDIGIMYAPQSRPTLTVEPLLEENLVLVSTDPEPKKIPGEDYVYIDWGPEFYSKHKINFPEFGTAPLVANIGWLGLQYILSNGGAGYFPIRIVNPYLEAGELTAVPGAPSFILPAYMVYPSEHDPDSLGVALSGMRQIAAAQV